MLSNLSENHQRLLCSKFSYQNHYYLFFWDNYGFIEKNHLEMTVIIKYQPPLETRTHHSILVYARNWNVLKYFSGYFSGMGGLAFSS